MTQYIPVLLFTVVAIAFPPVTLAIASRVAGPVADDGAAGDLDDLSRDDDDDDVGGLDQDVDQRRERAVGGDEILELLWCWD